MNSHLEYVFAAVLCTECFAGFMVNGIILAAIFLKWKAQRSLAPYYKILSCLVVSRGSYLLSFLFTCIISAFYPWFVENPQVDITIHIETMFFTFTDIWFATVLCVFYCVKITSYNSKFWISLKIKIPKVISWLLLAAIVISLSTSLPMVFLDWESKNFTNGAMENMTVYSDKPFIFFRNHFLIFLLGSYPPFLIFCVTICLLLHSLWMHTRRMRSSGSGFRSPNLESHFSAVKSMSFFLMLQITDFILINVFLLNRLYYQKVWRFVSLVITCSPSFLHSLYIIFSNSELKKTCTSMFHAFTSFLPV